MLRTTIHPSSRSSRVATIVGLALAIAARAHAVDGVVEINQASALAGGITACDAPGFPVSICTPGAYRLTSNLTRATAPGIQISADDVSLDLNGMTISGPNVCATFDPGGWVVGCSHPFGGSGNDGILVTAVARIDIHDGTVRGADGDCIRAAIAADLVVENVIVSECAGNGLTLGRRSVVSGVEAIRNRIAGIVVLLGGPAPTSDVQIADVVATNNGNVGIDTQFAAGGSIRDVLAAKNGESGITVGIGKTLRGFSAMNNAVTGVFLGDGSLAESGVIRNNGIGTSNCGLFGAGGAAYRSLVVTSVGGGSPSTACGAGLVNLGNNTCQGVACPP